MDAVTNPQSSPDTHALRSKGKDTTNMDAVTNPQSSPNTHALRSKGKDTTNMDAETNPQSSPNTYALRSKGKDTTNMDAETNPQSSPNTHALRSKAHLGGSDACKLDAADKIKVSNESNGNKTKQSQEAGDNTVSSDETYGDETKQNEEAGDDTVSSDESYGDETKQSEVSWDEAEDSLHPGDETDKSHISSDERDNRLVSVIGQYISAKGYYFLAGLVCIFAVFCLRPSPPPLQRDFNILEVFSNEMDKVQSRFPSQQSELWRRSRIHLKKHLNLTNPNEPVSLILASGRGAEKTLGCLALQIATAFTTALNSSVLGIDGTTKRAQDSDQVKLDIDRELREAFEGGTQAAIIHRFEELPPGSTLIFYRYCDHENAAYKTVFLAFTVMLQEHMEVPPNISLGMVEEMVQEYLKKKFVFSETSTKFNQMDVDKLSGLWSRISHVILPVTAERTVEQYGCPTSD